jgi:hypothetical protein
MHKLLIGALPSADVAHSSLPSAPASQCPHPHSGLGELIMSAQPLTCALTVVFIFISLMIGELDSLMGIENSHLVSCFSWI